MTEGTRRTKGTERTRRIKGTNILVTNIHCQQCPFCP
ncbi:MAG: YgiT-type zinc finger protein [Planctomycetaceae bacterium]|nr:YgiT-type zinc finger protein [Planctomycetaceae bacterium]